MAELNIVLVEPEIPQNTGNIARTCAVTGARLHIVKPMGFTPTDKHLKRAGLDYWNYLDLTYYENLDDFFEKTKGGTYYYFSKKANQYDNAEFTVRIPMLEGSRCLNLSSAAAVGAYEVLRQWGFPELSNDGRLKEYDWEMRNVE